MEELRNELLDKEINLFLTASEYITTGDVDKAVRLIKEYTADNEKELSCYFLPLFKIIKNSIKNQENLGLYIKEYPDAIYNIEIAKVFTKLQKYANQDYKELHNFKEDRHGEIWWCWLQGLEHAPAMVKACYHSLKQLNRTIHVITSENFSDYVDIPDYIITKWKEGIISNTHFSDVLRLELLTTYGGVWIDATVLITGTEHLEWLNDDLFVYKYINRGYDMFIRSDNWLISANKPSNILWKTKMMLLKYWKENDKLYAYFLFHYLFTMACEIYKEEWANISTWSSEVCHVLQMELMRKFSEKRWKQICSMTDVHKLTYKNEKTNDSEELFWDYIIRNN